MKPASIATAFLFGMTTATSCGVSLHSNTKNTMFTVAQIQLAHSQVKSGAGFPAYIQTIKKLGVKRFITYVKDSHTEYFGAQDYHTASEPMYADLSIADTTDKDYFRQQLEAHQQGKTDYMQFCKDCAAAGVEKWIVDLSEMTCIYYDKSGAQVLTEQIPEVA